MPMTPLEPGPSRLRVIGCIGLAQILAWGSSYYLIAVLARPIAVETGWSLSWIVGGLSLGFLVSGLVSPRVGRLIAAHGGRHVLVASAVLLAAGLALLAVAANIPVYIAAWLVLGVGMGAGLYDPAFSTLGRLYGETARSAITHVTLLGGFASTVCWPLSAFLVERLGWRGTCLAYAGLHLAVVLPLYLFGVPREPPHPMAAAVQAAKGGAVPKDVRVMFALLALALTMASVVMTVISVHLLTLLQARGVALAAAVGFGALIGPSQVGARVLEMALGKRQHPIWSLLVSVLLVAVGLGMLLGGAATIAVGIVLYACGGGIRSIARGTVPLALFGRHGFPILMGKLALPILASQAIAPALGAMLLDRLGATVTFQLLCGAAVLNVVPVLLLLPYALRRPIAA